MKRSESRAYSTSNTKTKTVEHVLICEKEQKLAEEQRNDEKQVCVFFGFRYVSILHFIV